MEPQIAASCNRDAPARIMSISFARLRQELMMRILLGLTIAGLLTLASHPATASRQGVVVMRNWKAMDVCTQKARAAFPDYTADANAKRDAQLRACLNNQNLPPRQPPAPRE